MSERAELVQRRLCGSADQQRALRWLQSGVQRRSNLQPGHVPMPGRSYALQRHVHRSQDQRHQLRRLRQDLRQHAELLQRELRWFERRGRLLGTCLRH